MQPYEPPPDYPMVESEWRIPSDYHHLPRQQRSQGIPLQHTPIDTRLYNHRLYRYPEPYRDIYQHPHSPVMLRTRQFPEVAGIFGCDEQPCLRRFTRYNEPMLSRDSKMQPQPVQQPATVFSKSSKKPSFFSGNWTFRDKKTSRPTLLKENGQPFRRDDRPVSMIVSDARLGGVRSRSETGGRQLAMGQEHRVPVRMERALTPERSTQDYTTRITVEDNAVLRPKKPQDVNNNRRSLQTTQDLRKSCPDLESVSSMMTSSMMDQMRNSKKRTRRAKEKAREARWNIVPVKDWCLDDVLLWLQHLQLDEVASLLIGYDLRGEDVIQWDHQCLAQLGVSEPSSRVRILDELRDLMRRGPRKEEGAEKKSVSHRTLFDLVKQTSYDQVLAVETPLTTRDITVTHGRNGCLQITKVNGSNLPLKEHDCLLEINERAGEQFKSALMLTKMITACGGEPIRFVVLRQKSNEPSEDSSNDTSSGISSSPRSPIE